MVTTSSMQLTQLNKLTYNYHIREHGYVPRHPCFDKKNQIVNQSSALLKYLKIQNNYPFCRERQTIFFLLQFPAFIWSLIWWAMTIIVTIRDGSELMRVTSNICKHPWWPQTPLSLLWSHHMRIYFLDATKCLASTPCYWKFTQF